MPLPEPPPLVRAVDIDLPPPIAGVERRDIKAAVADLESLLKVASPQEETRKIWEGAAERLDRETQGLLQARNSEHERSYSEGARVGEYSIVGEELVFQLSGEHLVEEVAYKVLRRLKSTPLAPEILGRLAEANEREPDVQNAFVELARDLGSPDRTRGTRLSFPEGTRIRCDYFESSKLYAVRHQIAADLAAALLPHCDSSLERGRLRRVEAEHRAESLLWRGMSLLSDVQADGSRYVFEGALGRLSSVQCVEQEPRVFEDVKSASDALFNTLSSQSELADAYPAAERAKVEAYIRKARSFYFKDRIEGMIMMGRHTAENDLPQALAAYKSALEYHDIRSMDSPEESSHEKDAKRMSIISEVKGWVTRSLQSDPGVPDSAQLQRLEFRLSKLLSPSEACLVISQGIGKAKEQVKISTDPTQCAPIVRELEKIDADWSRRALDTLMIVAPKYALDAGDAQSLTTSEREVALEAMLRLVRDAFERHDFTTRCSLEGALGTILDAERDPDFRDERELRAITLWAGSALSRTEAFDPPSPLLDRMMERGLLNPINRTPESIRETLMAFFEDKIEKLSSEREVASEELDSMDKSSPLYEGSVGKFARVTDQLNECVVTIQEGRHYQVVHASSPKEQAESFSKLLAVLEPRQEAAKKELTKLLGAREQLLQRNPQGRDAKGPMPSAATKELEHNQRRIDEASRSVVMFAVDPARIALEAQSPALMRRARDIIESIPSEAIQSQMGEVLLGKFKGEFESSSPTMAALRQLLHETVRDAPLHTLAGQLASGMLCVLVVYHMQAAARRNESRLLKRVAPALPPSLGSFALGSVAALALVKLYCVYTGVARTEAAFDTSLSQASGFETALNLCYLINDAGQLGYLLKGALHSMRGASIDDDARGSELKQRWSSAIRDILVEGGKLGLAQFNPKKVSFYVLFGPLAAVSYATWASGERPEEQWSEFENMVKAVIPTLGVGILHDVIADRYEKPKAPEAK